MVAEHLSAPGPMTLPPEPELGELTDDLLTRDFRVFQRAKGHRFSSDDCATAMVALAESGPVARAVDLGCGLGSVLLHLAWHLPHAQLVGVEAQAVSFELLRRNVERNGLSERIAIHHGDLRDPTLPERIGSGFPLVTGTPPYFPPESALDAMDGQRAYARIEYRGGVEAYVEAGAQLLSPDGTLVLCGAAEARSRVLTAASPLGLHLHASCGIVARADKPPLFAVWTLRPRPAEAERVSTLTLRTADGARTPDADRLRAFSGFSI